MKNKLFIICLLFGVKASNAQLIRVTESSANPAIVLNLSENPIVDINGKLVIQLDQAKITSLLANDKANDPQLNAKLKALIYILESQQSILESLKAPSEDTPIDKKQLNKTGQLMTNFYTKLIKYPDIRKMVDSLFLEYKKKGPTLNKAVYPTQESFIIKNLASITDNLVNTLKNEQGINNVKIQLVAFLSTKNARDQKVHIENFDNYSSGNYYSVPRWVTSFSQDDIKAFNQANQLSSDINSLVTGNYSALLKQIPDSLNAYKCFTKLITDFQNQINTGIPTASAEITEFINNADKQIKEVYDAMENLQLQKNTSGNNILQQFNDISANFISLAQNLPGSIKALENKLTSNVIQANNQVKALDDELNQCLSVLQSDIALVKEIYTTVSTLLQPFQSTANSVQQITGSQFSLSLNHLPAQGYIDLKTTGKRENGDEICIKVISQTQDDANSNFPGETLYSTTIELQQISFYSETSIGVILASPIGNSAEVTLKSKFQFAPAASLLLKFGSRKSRFWNAINPGIGFVLATPDFNLDGAPDVSYGGVFTLFHNVVSMGLAYDTKTSSSFWFFGLSLPFSTLGLPFGGNVQTQKTN